MILVKNFETNKVSRISIDDLGTKIIPYRSLKKEWYKESLKALKKVNPELLVLCPIYTSPNGHKDFQVGITGTKNKEDDTLLITLKRECEEEVGLIFNEFKGSPVMLNFFKGQMEILLCIAYLQSFRARTREEKDYEPIEHPNYRKKIVCFPIDTEKNMHAYLQRRVARAPNLTEHEYLKEVAAVPLWYLIDNKII
jgi:hypothetical protein